MIEPPGASAATSPLAVDHGSAGVERRERQSVLVIDDSPEIHELIEVRLQRDDLTVLHAMDARSGLEMARRRRPDLLLLDLEMPDQSGLDVCRQLVEDPDLGSIPIIILTGSSAVDRKVEAFDAGAVDYITKPFDHVELRARVQAALRLRRDARERQRLAHLGRMSAVMAHELRNPLASAKGNAQLLAEALDAESPAGKRADQVVREISRLEKLMNELLEFVRSGRVRRMPSAPKELVREAARAGGGAVTVIDDGAPDEFSLDPHAMERVLANLLRNAHDAQDGRPEPVELRVGMSGDQLRFTVRDHGPGLPAGLELFTPFVTTKRLGTGLGLAVSRQIVTSHGGQLVLENHPDGGAVAEVLIPPPEER